MTKSLPSSAVSYSLCPVRGDKILFPFFVYFLMTEIHSFWEADARRKEKKLSVGVGNANLVPVAFEMRCVVSLFLICVPRVDDVISKVAFGTVTEILRNSNLFTFYHNILKTWSYYEWETKGPYSRRMLLFPPCLPAADSNTPGSM